MRFNQTLHREVLDAELGLDAYIGAYVALREQLEVALLEAARAATAEPVMAQALDFMLRDKRRHAQFGWLYLAERRSQLDAARDRRPRGADAGALLRERADGAGPQPGDRRRRGQAIETAAAAGLGSALS